MSLECLTIPNGTPFPPSLHIINLNASLTYTTANHKHFCSCLDHLDDKTVDDGSKSAYLSFNMRIRRKFTTFGKDGRRKHHHFRVTIYYGDGETFARMYTDRERADRFAIRQRKSPVVKRALVSQIS